MTISLATLKQVKNTVIGNPQAKSHVATDDDFIVNLVHSLTQPPPAETDVDDPERRSHEAFKIEAAHIVASLAHGSENAIAVLLRARVVRHLIYALSTFTATNSSPALRHAYMRSLRACATGAADIVGPSLWGLKPELGVDAFTLDVSFEEQERRKREAATIWADAKTELDHLFLVDSMDVYLPLLVLPSPISTSPSPGMSRSSSSSATFVPSSKPSFPSTPILFTHAAHLLSTTLRNPMHRKAVSEWVPPHLREPPISSTNKRARAASLGRRGWEAASLSADRDKERERYMCVVRGILGVLGLSNSISGATTAGGNLNPNKDPKVVEAALSALAALAKDNPPVAAFLGKHGNDRDYPPTLPHFLAFTKSRIVDVQLAACLCVTNILRALPASNTNSHPTPAPLSAVSPTVATAGSSSAGGHSYSRSTSNPYPFVDPLAYLSTGTAGPSGSPFTASATAGSASGSGTTASALGHTAPESVSAYSLVHNLPGGGGAPGPSQQAVEENCLRTVLNVVNRMLGLSFAGFGAGAAASTGSGAGSGAGTGTGTTRSGMAAGFVASLAGGATTTGMAAARGAAAAAASGAGAGGAMSEAEAKEAEREREARYQAAMAGAAQRARASYILHYLVMDDLGLCRVAYERGCLDHLGALMLAISPPEPPPLDWEESEPESVREMREAALTALASLAFHGDDIRRAITDTLRLLPAISRALRAGSSSSASPSRRAKHIGTRHAACQVVRAMSRSVSVLRTSIVDSGLGMDVLRIVLGRGTELGDRWGGSVSAGSSRSGLGGGNGIGNIGMSGRTAGASTSSNLNHHGKARERDVEGMVGGGNLRLGDDRRVIAAALGAVCNIVNDFSPLRPVYLEENLMPRLVAMIRESQDVTLRLNALWAIKNIVRKTSTETKRDIMSHVGWANLNSFFTDPNFDMQEQAFNLVRNLAENEEGIAMVFRELTPSVLLGKLVDALNSDSQDVVLQATYALANLANGNQEQQDAITHFPNMLEALKQCLEEGTPNIRRPAIGCIFMLLKGNPRRRREMQNAGLVETLQNICNWSGHRHGSSHGHHGHTSSYSGSGAGGYGMSISPTVSASGGGWGGRNPSTRAFGMSYYHGGGALGSGSGGASSTYGSWSGSGSVLHTHAAAHGMGGTGTGARPWSTPQLGLLEDDGDVVQTASRALDLLKHGESYSMGP